MKNKKLTKVIASAALVGLLGVGATLAYFTDNDSAKNVITMGHVDIDLDEPTWEANNPGGEIENVKPGDKIAKDPRVTLAADSEDAYVRVKLEITGLDSDKITDLLSKNDDGSYKYLDIDTSKWTASGEYFYYNDVLTAGDKVVLFNNVTIPTTWGNEVVNTTFNIDITAEAIQADNFEPSTVNGVYGWFADGEEVTVDTYTPAE